MFTGLIEEIGSVRDLSRKGSGYLLSLNCGKVMEDLRPGDSIAVDGVCQTVVSSDTGFFSVFVSGVTASLTTFISFRAGRLVNLERAMPSDGRFGGHIVQGHVDGTGTVRESHRDESGLRLSIGCSSSLMHYIVAKGSVCVNGVSLTVVDASEDRFGLYLIPETLGRTTLPLLASGDAVNVETDILAKYIEKLFGKESVRDCDASLKNALAENGFL